MPLQNDLCRQQAPDLEEVHPTRSVIGKRVIIVESQSQPDPVRNMLFSADQKVHTMDKELDIPSNC